MPSSSSRCTTGASCADRPRARWRRLPRGGENHGNSPLRRILFELGPRRRPGRCHDDGVAQSSRTSETSFAARLDDGSSCSTSSQVRPWRRREREQAPGAGVGVARYPSSVDPARTQSIRKAHSPLTGALPPPSPSSPPSPPQRRPRDLQRPRPLLLRNGAPTASAPARIAEHVDVRHSPPTRNRTCARTSAATWMPPCSQWARAARGTRLQRGVHADKLCHGAAACVQSKCADVYGDCNHWAKEGACTSNARASCDDAPATAEPTAHFTPTHAPQESSLPVSCGVCRRARLPTTGTTVPAGTKKGECATNPAFALKMCAYSCGVCGEDDVCKDTNSTGVRHLGCERRVLGEP